MEFVWFIIVGLIAGWLAGVIMKGGGFGVVGDIVVGIIGALLGGFLATAGAAVAIGRVGQFQGHVAAHQLVFEEITLDRLGLVAQR